MINNKQVNFWRGDKEPPTIYHIWIKDNSKMLLYNDSEWVVFLDNKEIIEQVNNLLEATINGKAIKDNPTLTGEDIKLNKTGTYIESNTTISDNIQKLDTLLTTQIIN